MSVADLSAYVISGRVVSHLPGRPGASGCALGSTAACVAKLAEFRAAGANEIVSHGSTPGQNAALISAWRAR
jgi:hypothetical protein